MKRFLSATLLLLAFASTNALADSFTVFFYPNDGGGGNFEFKGSTSTASVLIIGGTAVNFFASMGPNGLGYDPGSSLGGGTQVFFSLASVVTGGNQYDLGAFSPGTLFMSPFTLPTDGKNFSAPVHIDFSASMYYTASPGAPLTPVTISGSAMGSIPFTVLNGAYYPDSAGFVQMSATGSIDMQAVQPPPPPAPEPSTWALFGTGVIGISAAVRKRKNPIS